MDNDYSREKMAAMHDKIVELKTKIKSMGTCIQIYRVLALAGWTLFVFSLIFGGDHVSPD